MMRIAFLILLTHLMTSSAFVMARAPLSRHQPVVLKSSPVTSTNDMRSERLVRAGYTATWMCRESSAEQMKEAHIFLSTHDGAPFDAHIEVWDGPVHTPCKIRVQSCDGESHPFGMVLPIFGENVIAVRNGGCEDMPIMAKVTIKTPANTTHVDKCNNNNYRNISGGTRQSYVINPSVARVLFKGGEHAVNARLELIDDAQDVKQVAELYTFGPKRFLSLFMAMMNSKNIVRVINTSPKKFIMQTFLSVHTA